MVIQRWQSVLLLIAAIAMCCFTFMSLGQVQTPEYTLNFTTLGYTYEGVATEGGVSGYYEHTGFLFVLSLVAALLPLVSIFMFKRLSLQVKMCVVAILVLLATAAYCGVSGYTAVPDAAVSWSSVIIGVPVALCAELMAIKYIRHDANLLRAVDRIR
ncbi:MAG: DUF4293 domain-containing protein [Muribaculaceae bacterium]|nr:DUF4293 domain-containing protein [Muribaculaceae bacterium]